MFPVEKWAHQFSKIEFFSNKKCYGMAYPDGTIGITDLFIGTNEYQKLNDTIIHEISHLIVGVQHNHNQKFKNMATALGCTFKQSNLIFEKYLENKKTSYNLYIIFSDGTEILYKKVSRKHNKYTEYSKNDKILFCEGKPIKEFRYEKRR